LRKKLTYLFLVFAVILQAQTTITYLCILRSNAQKDTLCDGRVLPIFGIASTLSGATKIPAKILYCNEGDSVVLNTKSISQGEHHTIHLHGLDVDTRNDGDPATSFWLSHQQDTTYSFKAKNAGTYLYHCHAADVVHVQMGMYGMIVVRAAGGVKTVWTGGPVYNKDYKWLMSEIDSTWHYHVPVHDTLLDTLHIPKYQPNYFLINGKCGSEISNDDSIKVSGSQNEKILLRLANIGYLTNRIVFPNWLNAQILDSDGRPLPNAIVNDTCYIMPGERYSVMIQSNVQNSGTINVAYVDMNTGAAVQTDPVPVNINGVFGVKERTIRASEILVYPNPAHDQLNIEGKEFERMEIYNSIGDRVISIGFSGKLDISTLKTGFYILKLSRVNGETMTSKFIKEE
jgi:hypothetical protein